MRTRRRRALCVGINYAGTRAELNGCLNDAQDWARALDARGYDVTPLHERQATKHGILSALSDLVDGARWGDRLVFTYSGHGTSLRDLDGDEADGRDEALVAFDMRTITDDELHNVVGRIPLGVRLTIVSDSCNSGTMTRFAGSFEPPSTVEAPAKPRFLPTSDVIADSAPRGKGLPAKVMLLSGCKDDEVSYDALIGGRWRGAMTAAALATLPQARNMRDWQRRTLLAIRHPQTPQLTATAHQRYGFRPFA